MNINDEKASVIRRAKTRNANDLVFSIDGARGRHMDVFPYKVIIKTNVTLGSVITKNATDGEKTIYLKDIIGLQFKPCGVTLGYLQFETATSSMNNEKSNFFNENTFTYNASTESQMADVYWYIRGILDDIKLSEMKYLSRIKETNVDTLVPSYEEKQENVFENDELPDL